MSNDEHKTLPSQVCLAMMRLGTRMATGFDQKFADEELTQAQFRLLLTVWELGGHDGVAPSVLAEHLFLERATVSVLAHRLVERGLLARAPGENRRTHLLVVSERGGAVLTAMGARATQLAAATLADFSPDEQVQFLTLLTRLESHLRADAALREERKI